MRKKIFLVILISFFLSAFFKKTIFIADTPAIRTDLSVNSIIASVSGVNALRQVAKGVYAKETKTSSEKIYHMNDIAWVEHTYIVNGKKVTIKVAKGDDVPSQSVMEQIYK